MKIKNFLTFSLAASVALFATSCSEDEDDPINKPTLSVVETNTNSSGGDITIEVGDQLNFTWDARDGDSRLETFAISQTGDNVTLPAPDSNNGHMFPYDIPNASNETYVDGITFENAGTTTGLTTYTFTVTDKNGQTASVTYDVNVEAVATATPLSTPQNFEWVRTGSTAGTGLDQFGLKWTENTSTNAIIAVNGATMVKLDDSDWQSIQNKEDLSSQIDDAIGTSAQITTYTEVSSTGSGTPLDVLGVRYNNVDYMLQIQTTEATSNPNGSTTIEINGQSKS